MASEIILTTTNRVDKREICEYLGLVSGAECYKCFNATEYQDLSFTEAVKKASEHLTERAKELGADAVIGITQKDVIIGNREDVLVTLVGTAVKTKALS